MHVIALVDMFIEVAADNDWTPVRQQLLKHRRQFVEERRRHRLTARSVNAEQQEMAVVGRRVAAEVLERSDVNIETTFCWRWTLTYDICCV